MSMENIGRMKCHQIALRRMYVYHMEMFSIE